MSITHLRHMVATIEGEFAELTAAVAGTEPSAALVADLRLSWARLVQMLPLHSPLVQGCPVCRRIVPWAATFCGHCFSKLTPDALGA
jgi:hypothetical protein